jgi:maltose O-acetyltransferase
MLAGEPYDAGDPELVAERARAHALCQRLGTLPVDALDERAELLAALFGRRAGAFVTPPFFCDYGYNCLFGDGVYFNAGCVVLDVMPVRIGERTLLGPGVHVYAATHPVSAAERRRGLEGARPVDIGRDVWIGGHTVICPGVRVGDEAVIGAGSVVTRDVPARTVAAGNPCRVIRVLDEGAAG